MNKTIKILLLSVIVLAIIVGGLFLFLIKKPQISPNINTNINFVTPPEEGQTAEQEAMAKLEAIKKEEEQKLGLTFYWLNQLSHSNSCISNLNNISLIDENKDGGMVSGYVVKLNSCLAYRQNDDKLCNNILESERLKSFNFDEDQMKHFVSTCKSTFMKFKIKDLRFNDKLNNCDTDLANCKNINSSSVWENFDVKSKDEYCEKYCAELIDKDENVCNSFYTSVTMQVGCKAYVRDDVSICDSLDTGERLQLNEQRQEDCRIEFYTLKYIYTKNPEFLDKFTRLFDKSVFLDENNASTCEELALKSIQQRCDVRISEFKNSINEMEKMDCDSLTSSGGQSNCKEYKNKLEQYKALLMK